MTFFIFFIFVIFTGFTGVSALQKPAATLFSDTASVNKYGSWLDSDGKGNRPEVISESGKRIIYLKNDDNFRSGFNRHSPLPLTFKHGTQLHLEIKCKKPGINNRITFFWEYDGGIFSKKTTTDFITTTGWRKISVPLPDPVNRSAVAFRLRLKRKDDYRITNIQIMTPARIVLYPLTERELIDGDTINISGRVDADIKRIAAKYNNRIIAETTSDKGGFLLELQKKDLIFFKKCNINLVLSKVNGETLSTKLELYVFPALKNTKLPAISVKDGKLYQSGKPYAFIGINYTGFQTGLSIHKKKGYAYIADSVKEMSGWGITAVRIPLSIALLQPAENVFPDSANYTKIMLRHKLKPDFFKYLEYFIQLAADHGIYSIIEFHDLPVDPYNYFAGGNSSQMKHKLPGSAISWLVEDKKTKRVFPDFRKRRELKAICSTFSWMAGHFRGNSNILGFEAPYNEPHDSYMSVQKNFLNVTAATANAIKQQDAERLTFQVPAAWGHDNSSWDATWLLARGVSGLAPHFYVANGPVSLRPDAHAHKQRYPWLCRDVNKTFDYSMAAMLFPFSTQSKPVYNGEGGDHGRKSFLPGLSRAKATEYMIDATLTQCYAAGLSGALQWMLWGNRKGFLPFMEIYRHYHRRFSRVFAAGPVDWSKAEVAFIQNVAAVPVDNGYNLSCVPFVKIMLDLHLAPVHYLTDDELIYSRLSSVSKGLEQTSDASFSSSYKALIADRRNLDARIERVLKKSGIPVLWLERPQDLTSQAVKSFLDKAGVFVNAKSPPEIQIIKGPEHLILYRRRGNDKKPVTVFPHFTGNKEIILIDEVGKTVFSGSTAQLYAKGISVNVPKWQSVIYKIKAASH